MNDFIDFALKLSNYTPLKRFLCLKWILTNFSTNYILSSNNRTLPVIPFKPTFLLVNIIFWA